MKKSKIKLGRWRRANNYDPYKRLAAAVVAKAANDYYTLARKLTSPYLDECTAASLEVEANGIEAWLLDPTNEMVGYVGLDAEVIEDFILRVSEGQDITTLEMHKHK